MKTEKHAWIIRRRNAQAAALASLHADPANADGEAMLRALRRAEGCAYRIALHYCNGTGGVNTENIEEHAAPIVARVRRIFGGKLPVGFRLNYDARGYALKLDPDHGAEVPEGMETDWGRNGILAPEIK